MTGLGLARFWILELELWLVHLPAAAPENTTANGQTAIPIQLQWQLAFANTKATTNEASEFTLTCAALTHMTLSESQEVTYLQTPQFAFIHDEQAPYLSLDC